MSSPIATRILQTPVGPLRVEAASGHLLRLDFLEAPTTQKIPRSPSPLLDRLEWELREYFEGRRTRFTLPLFLEGSPFEMAAWRALLEIPHGATLSYREQAKRIGRPAALRAVGSANGRNPIPILIPCHRVIRSDGSLGGYAGGIEIKRRLLALERA